jgi:hypothetical protein
MPRYRITITNKDREAMHLETTRRYSLPTEWDRESAMESLRVEY